MSGTKISAAKASWPAVLLLGLFACGSWGCASAPSGGATVPDVANQLQVTLTLQKNFHAGYYYAVAFDDHAGTDNGGTGDGPIAILGGTPILNGVVGGNWRVAVLCYGNGQFTVYWRSDPTDRTTERTISNGCLIRKSVSGNEIQFTLNLDYEIDSTKRLFPLEENGQSTQRFDVNFVTTPTRSVNSSSGVKPVDSNGQSETSQPVLNVQLSGTTHQPISDASGDSNDYTDRPTDFDFGQIDVVQLDLLANRTDVP